MAPWTHAQMTLNSNFGSTSWSEENVNKRLLIKETTLLKKIPHSGWGYGVCASSGSSFIFWGNLLKWWILSYRKLPHQFCQKSIGAAAFYKTKLTIGRCRTLRSFSNLFRNKPSFCSGSCDKIHATKKLQNKTSLKDSWNTLETFYDIFLKHTCHFL